MFATRAKKPPWRITTQESQNFFVIPSRKKVQLDSQRNGSFSMASKVFGICFQLGYLSGRAAHPTQHWYTRTEEEIIEYELFFSQEERDASDFALRSAAEQSRLRLGHWPIDHVAVQLWMYSVMETPDCEAYRCVALTLPHIGKTSLTCSMKAPRCGMLTRTTSFAKFCACTSTFYVCS